MFDLIVLSWKHIAALAGLTLAFAVFAAPDLASLALSDPHHDDGDVMLEAVPVQR